jgi:exodeoxyribonuclease VIII
MKWVVESQETYLSAPGVQSSALKELALRTPAHYLHRINNKKAPTPAMEFGTKVHSALLENVPVTIMPKFDRRTNEGKQGYADFLAISENMIVATEEEAERIAAMRNSVYSLEGVAEAVASGHIERSGYGKLRGHDLKIRPDILHNGILYDLKTTLNASPESFARDAFNFGYHIQAAMYLALTNVIEPESAYEFRWIAVEKEAPNCASLFVASPEFIQLGMVAVVEALGKLTIMSDCSITNVEGLGYPLNAVELAPPLWALKNMGEIE